MLSYSAKFHNNKKSNRMASTRKYAKINFEMRKKLIELVHSEGCSFKKAADILGINQSTARMIVRKYERQGALFEKKQDKTTRIEIQKALERYQQQN